MKSGCLLLSFLIIFTALAVSCGQTGHAEKPTTDTVIISEMKFNPAELVVHKNDTVIWINQDIVSHNVADFPDMKWKSDTLSPGNSWKKVADEDLNYFCTIHPTMKGKVVVKK